VRRRRSLPPRSPPTASAHFTDAASLVLADQLASHGATLLSLAHLTVYLSSTPSSSSSLSSSSTMALFPRINAVYSSYFGTSPPTRACVEVPGPAASSSSAWRVKLEGVARLPGAGVGATEERKALHVQGLSYWAPANIGPYSQSILVRSSSSRSRPPRRRAQLTSRSSPPSFAS